MSYLRPTSFVKAPNGNIVCIDSDKCMLTWDVLPLLQGNAVNIMYPEDAGFRIQPLEKVDSVSC